MEKYVQEVSKSYPNVDTYVIAGGDGVDPNYPIISSNNNLNPSITVPQGVWKVVVSENRQDNSNSPLFANFGTYIGNDDRKEVKWYDQAFTYSIRELEKNLNSTRRNSPSNSNISSPAYDFFNHLPNQIAQQLKSSPANIRFPISKSTLIAEELAFSHESNFAEFGFSEFSTIHLTVNEFGLPQLSLIPDSIAEVAVNEDKSYTTVNPSEIGTSEVDIITSNNIPDSISKISFSQNSTTKINSEIGTLQINTAEVNTSKHIVTPIPDIKPSKISLSSSISPQQFFNSNFFSFDFFSFDFHSSTPLLDNIYSSINTKQNHLLDPTFNINFQITDLPTGQLAEAQITNYDTLGRPNGGTILIDTDANGIGWFIDPTPADNSEFTQPLTDTAFHATTGDAYGKYDLLTSILHEMGHLAGIITGYTEFDRHIQTVNGSSFIVSHADPYRTLYVERGEVVEDLNEEVVVAWDHWRNESKKTDRYFRDELRFWQPE